MLRIIRVFYCLLTCFSYSHKAFTVSMLSLNYALFTVSKLFEEMSRCGGFGNHMKTHERDVKGGSLLAFVKRAPAKKPTAIAIKKAKQEPLQVKLTFSKRKQEPSMNTDNVGP